MAIELRATFPARKLQARNAPIANDGNPRARADSMMVESRETARGLPIQR
jgi:hypothetical protein